MLPRPFTAAMMASAMPAASAGKGVGDNASPQLSWIKNRKDLASLPAKLDAINTAIDQTKFANVFVDRVYTLREHVEFVRLSLK